jgi:hypothetical protein
VNLKNHKITLAQIDGGRPFFEVPCSPAGGEKAGRSRECASPAIF